MEGKSWKIDKDARRKELEAWLDYQIELRENMLEESEFDSGIQAPCDMNLNILGETMKSVRISGLSNVARILDTEMSTVNNVDFDGKGTIATVMYKDYLLYDKVG